MTEDSEHTTAVLLGRIRAGDARARGDLVARVEPLLWRFARGRVPQLMRHEQDTADLVQSTWLKVLDKLTLIVVADPGDFFAYLRAVFINALRESLRRHQRSPIDANADAADAVDLSLPACSVEPLDWLAYEQSLQRLEAPYRNLLLMRFEFGMSFAEIGTELGESADGVRMKLNRAVARIAAQGTG